MFEAKLHIRGEAVSARDGAVFNRRSPVDGAVVTRASAAGPKDAIDAANAAAAAFPIWRATSDDAKRDVLKKARDILIERADRFVDVAQKELGSTANWTRFNIDIAARVFDQALKIPDRLIARTQTRENDGIHSTLMREPVGVVLAIAPWNAAVTLAIRSIVWPLACGNTVVFKPSELCPKLHSMIVEVFNDAGVPDGAICSVLHAPDAAEAVVDALAAHPSVRRINFTGSTRVGRRVAQIAASHLKPCLLELSGKAPLIVLADADIQAAAAAAIYGAYFNQGQICMASERVVLLEEVAVPFLEEMRAGCLALGQNKDKKIGDLISIEAAQNVKQLIDDAVSKGAVLICGGEVSGAYVEPTLLDHVTPDMRIYREESFGPVLCIIRAFDDAEAVTIANDTEYGLVASVYTSNPARGKEIAAQLETGVCHINGPTVYDDPAMPFGGMKASGYGRFGGETAIDEFTELRWITTQDPKSKFDFWT